MLIYFICDYFTIIILIPLSCTNNFITQTKLISHTQKSTRHLLIFKSIIASSHLKSDNRKLEEVSQSKDYSPLGQLPLEQVSPFEDFSSSLVLGTMLTFWISPLSMVISRQGHQWFRFCPI